MFRTPSRDELVATLKDLNRPIAARMRAIFYLRSMPKDTMEGNVEVLCEALKDVRGTALFRHEIAYVLGQMQAGSATPTLLSILADVNDDVVVRHEVSRNLILSWKGKLNNSFANIIHQQPFFNLS
jgi:deoxyhypusine monooxygenase